MNANRGHFPHHGFFGTARAHPRRQASCPGPELLESRCLLSASSIEIMPLGDSITAGAFAWGEASGGYRLGLYEDLRSDGVTFNYVGSQIDTLSAPLIAVDETHYDGHPGYRADELADNLLGVDIYHSGNNGGHWLNGTGSRPAVYPNIVLVEAGTNDVLENDSASEVSSHISYLIDILTKARPDADILLESLLPIDEPQFLPVVQQVNASIRNTIVPEYQHYGFKVTFVDEYHNFVNASGNVISSLLYDHIHPVAAGYTLMANTWAAAITSVLKVSTPTPATSPTSSVYLINAGGTAPYTDHTGNTWSADEFFTGGADSDVPYTVPDTADGIVFYDRRTGTDFSYNLPVADGTYTVELFFTDPTYSTARQRLFNVTAQGQTVLSDFDIIGDGGGKAPITRAFSVTVTNGRIALGFTSVLNYATLSGIEVLKQG